MSGRLPGRREPFVDGLRADGAGADPGPAMRSWVGTSGFAYKGWRGAFYPEDLPEKEFLAWYSTKLPTVEINNTFYRMPSRKALSAWSHQTPEAFSFVLKASRKITHFKRLRDCAAEMEYLLDVMGELGPRLGPTLFQTPPHLKKDAGLLSEFLSLFPGGFRAAFEFRHVSWLDDEVYGILEAAKVALVAAEAEDEALLAVVETAPYGYARLRLEQYGAEELALWADRFNDSGWNDVFVFFKHEDSGTGPQTAVRFLDILSDR